MSLVWYLFTAASHNGYLTGGSNGNAYSITTNRNVCVASWVQTHTIFGFCPDSRNSLNSVKIIWVKTQLLL